MNLLFKLLFSKSFKMALKLLGTWGRMWLLGRGQMIFSGCQREEKKQLDLCGTDLSFSDLFIYFSFLPCRCPLIALCFSPVSSYLPIILFTPLFPYLLFHYFLLHLSLFAFTFPCSASFFLPCLCFPSGLCSQVCPITLISLIYTWTSAAVRYALSVCVLLLVYSLIFFID